MTSTLTGVQLPQFASSLAAATTASTSTSSSLTAGVQNNITTAPVGKTPGLSLGPTFVQQPSPQVALPGGGGGGGQFGIFQAPTSANTANTAGATTMGGGFLAAANATITAANSTGAAAPSTSSGGFKFSLNLPTTTQQQQQPPQPSGLMFPSTKPLSTAGSSVSTGSIFGLNSGLQTNTSKPQPSSNGTGGITFGVPQQQLQQQQPGQLSLFSGMQSQSGQNGGGLSFNFPQSKISGTQQTQASAAVGGALNFNFSAGAANSAQQNVPGGSGGLSFPAGSQSSGGLSLFNSAGNGQQSHHHQQQKPLSIFSAGGPTNLQQPNQSSGGGGLFNSQSQPQQMAAAFTGFKLSTGTSGSQAQGNQLSLFGNTNSVTANPLSGGNAGINTGGLNFTARQQQSGVGGATNGSSSTFNFSAGSQQQPTQNQGGLFAFGQKPNPTGGVNFAGNGSGPGLGIGNQAQSGNGGFNFGASTGMGLNAGGVKPSAGLFGNNSSSNIFQPPVQQQPSSNIFQTPQTQKQLSFTATPTNQQTPGQGGFAFQATPSFSSGTPGGSASRPVARARRRKK